MIRAFAAASLLLGPVLFGAAAPPPSEVRAQLDAAIEAKWKALGVTAAGPADDATFLRRVYLDLTGRVPPPLKVREFLDDRDPARRTKLVEALLASEEYAEHWGRSWAEALTGRRPTKQEKYDGRLLQDYLKQSLTANKSYRQIVTELICAEGTHDVNGAANFLLRYEAKPTDLAGAVSRQFLGVTLQCAQCHDHPFAAWKKHDFWGVAAFFGRTRMFEANDENQYHTAILETRKGELMIPDADAKPDENGQVPKKKVEPRLPGQKTAAAPDNRRRALATWVTADNNPYFARNFVNRVWTQLFGTGLVRGFDQPTADGDGKHAQLLDLLAQDFTASGHDVKRLLRVIVLSRPYQLSAGGGTATDTISESDAEQRHRKLRNLARFPARPLSVDQLYQSIAQATGHRGPEPDAKAQAVDYDEETTDKSIELLTERALTVQRSLVLLNSEYIHQAARAGARTAATVVGRRAPAAQVEWLFLSTLARRPTADESAAMLDLLKESKGTRGLEDILWVLLNSVEFTTNH